MAVHPNAALIRKGYEAFGRGDLAALSQLFAQDVLWHEAGSASTPVAGDYKGQEAVFTMFGQLVQLTDEFSVTLEECIADERQAVAIHTMFARRGSTTYYARGALVFHLLEGRVTDAWHTVPDVDAYDLFWTSPLDQSTSEQNVANARRGYEAFANGDLATLSELLSDDVVWHVNTGSPFDGDYQGQAATFGYFAELAQELQGSLRIDVHEILANDDHVTVMCNVTAVRNGVTFADTIVQAFHVRDGKTTECWTATTNPQKAVAFWAD
jgi:ketosteroid isomerase-like protein